MLQTAGAGLSVVFAVKPLPGPTPSTQLPVTSTVPLRTLPSTVAVMKRLAIVPVGVGATVGVVPTGVGVGVGPTGAGVPVTLGFDVPPVPPPQAVNTKAKTQLAAENLNVMRIPP